MVSDRSRFGRLMQESVRISPAPGSHSPAWRASVTLLVGLVTLAVTGHMELAAYACFGTFASIYGGRQPLRGRWRTQAAAGALMCGAVLCGALVATSPHRAWLVVPVAAVWTAAGSILSDRFVLRPPGPMFPVFAVATCAALPVTMSGVVIAVGVAAAAALVAVLLGLLEERLFAGGGHVVAARGEIRVDHAIAVVVAGSVSTALGLSHTYWAMVAAAVPFGVTGLLAQTTRGLQRVVGTVIGLLLAGILLSVSLPALVVAVVVAALQAITELLIGRHYGLALVVITPLSLLMVQLGHPQPVDSLLWSRLAETVLGVVVGLAAAFALREVRLRRASG